MNVECVVLLINSALFAIINEVAGIMMPHSSEIIVCALLIIAISFIVGRILRRRFHLEDNLKT